MDKIQETLSFSSAACDLGILAIVESEVGLCAVALGDDAEELELDCRMLFPKAGLAVGSGGRGSQLGAVARQVSKPSLSYAGALDIRGTRFQQEVWRALLEISPGETKTYGELARDLGRPFGARAVAGACAANRLAVVIPCHRVIGAEGNLRGFRWGVDRKRELLEREARGGASRRRVLTGPLTAGN